MLRLRCCLPPPIKISGYVPGLALSNKAPSSPKLKYETVYVSGIFVKFECQARLHERKASPHRREAPLLTTFWRLFWFNGYMRQNTCYYHNLKWTLTGMWSRKSHHPTPTPTPTPGNFDYPTSTPTPTPTPDQLRPSAVLLKLIIFFR